MVHSNVQISSTSKTPPPPTTSHHDSNNMTPTYYTILSLPASLPPTHPTYQTTLKKAYHRTLLRCHPDKLSSGGVNVDSLDRDENTRAGQEDEPIYTIDQINTAYKTLSSPSTRKEYDTSLRLLLSQGTSPLQKDGYKTGLDIVDLDDMVYRDPIVGDSTPGGSGGRFTRSCRCGADEGYVLTEQDMDEIEQELERQQNTDGKQQQQQQQSTARSMIIGCLGCSLWVQVDWVVCDVGEEED
ncbi:hypothetical protein H072_2950 [Dactylellina haptotyla CBS 200.50]|uniref:Diphthamide biosynthesis protein 4 n=1 Tax=Dactylellina haptotyla (strain CBS 200.50) TaxID=1284197 RepID=S8AJD2_DACHA|nr:hypothetical protein H072_2950 [Dactylellina haptotyla CBS 200.50]